MTAAALISATLLVCSLVGYASSLPPPNVSPASNYTIPTESTDNVTYVCEADVGTVYWELNRRQIQGSEERADYEANGIFIEDRNMSTLTVTAEGRRALLNPILVVCYASRDLNAEPGDKYYIELFNAPSPPGDLQLNYYSEDQLILKWKRPTELSDNVNVVYYIEIANLTSGNVIQEYETTATYILINQTVDERCQPHSFTVTARNDAGMSNGTSIQESIPISPDVTPISVSQKAEQVLLIGNTSVNITLSFEPAIYCSTQFPVLNHTVSIEGLEGSLTIEDASDYSSTLSVVLSSSAFPELVQDQQYSIVITACTNFTCRSPPDVLIVVTTGVQSASAVFYDTTASASLKCTFAVGSSARGCLFVFPLTNEDSTDNSTVYNLGKEGFNTSCAQLSNTRAAYDSVIPVYGINSDGSIGSQSVMANVTVETEMGSFPCPLPSDGDDENVLSTDEIAGIVVASFFAVLFLILFIVSVACAIYLYKSNKIHFKLGKKPQGRGHIKVDSGVEGIKGEEVELETQPADKSKISAKGRGHIKDDGGAEGTIEGEGDELNTDLLIEDPVAHLVTKDFTNFKLALTANISHCVEKWKENAREKKKLYLYCKLD